MGKVPIHFIGFLANADHSLAGIKMGDGFAVERRSTDDVAPFLKKIDKYYGLPKVSGFLNRNCVCVVKADLNQFEGTPQGGVAFRPHVSDDAYRFVQDKCRLLRLFKEGNVVLEYSFLYHVADADGEVKPFGIIRVYPILDTTPFSLTPAEIPDAESFLRTTSLPFQEKSLQLALDSFDRSYETDDAGLAFLSLMIAMEVLLHPRDRDELKYRICRNAGVLLGQNPSGGEAVFREMKNLYDKRSALVHSGDRSSVTRQDVLRLRQYVRETIKEAMSSRMSKDELLKTLNACGFGQRPWRENTV